MNTANIQTSVNKTNFASELGSSVAMAGIMSGGFGSITAVKTHGKNTISATKANNAVLKQYKNKLGSETDVFTKSIKTAYNYQEYTKLTKQRAKLAKKAKRLPISDKIKNLFSKNKVTTQNYLEKLKAFDNDVYNSATKKLKEGKSISSEVLANSATKTSYKIENLNKNIENFTNKEITELPIGQKIKDFFTGKKTTIADYKTAKLNKLENKSNILTEKLKKLNANDGLETAKTIKQSTKGLLKSELKDPFGIFFAATETFTRLSTEAIPAFKNEGFIAGAKATAKAVVAGVATWATDAGLSVAFRTMGATVGSIFGPAGSAVGSLIGNTIGGLLSCKLVQKILPTKEQNEQLANATQDLPDVSQKATAPVQQTQVQNANQTHEISQQLTPEQARQIIEAQNQAKLNSVYA